MLNQYQSIETTTKGGVRYFLFTEKGGQAVRVYDANMNFYGSYHSVDSFVKHLKLYGQKGLLIPN